MPRRILKAVLRLVRWVFGLFIGFFVACTLLLALYGVVDPPITTVQLQRSIEAGIRGESPVFRRDQVSRNAIAPSLGNAVVAAEDGRFYDHPGIDFEAIEQAIEDNRTRRRARGGSTITQQLVKNLFLTTHSNYVRKALELPLALIADLILSKERQLTLYMNNVEWGPGLFGAESAARHHLGKAAADLSRTDAAGLASLLPAPRKRTIGNSAWYRTIILQRMAQMGY